MTADDLHRAVGLAVAALRDAEPSAWDAKAGSLRWTCWETVEHLSDDLFYYATELGAPEPPQDTELPFEFRRRRPSGPANIIHALPDAGPDGLLRVLEASAALLVAMVRTTPPSRRAYHLYGASDPEGFAAMGIVETLVHAHDIAEGLDLAWDPPAELSRKALTRLFPHVPDIAGPWETLLWATGRGELPGHPRQTSWRWYGQPRT